MNLKKWLRLASVRAAIFTLLLVIPIIVGIWESMPLIAKFVFVSLVCILNIVWVYFERRAERACVLNNSF
jgi:TctA family transporter